MSDGMLLICALGLLAIIAVIGSAIVSRLHGTVAMLALTGAGLESGLKAIADAIREKK